LMTLISDLKNFHEFSVTLMSMVLNLQKSRWIYCTWILEDFFKSTHEIHTETIDAMLNQIIAFQKDKFVGSKTTLEQYGLDKPSMVIAINNNWTIKFGKKEAVICGDYLLSVALQMSASIPNKKDYLDLVLPDYVGKVCLGELSQHINNGNVNLSVYQYLKIISGKTAALFEASYFAGAIMSGCSEREAKRYRQLGYYIGMNFQLTDDCIDFEDTIKEANKPVQSDYEQGVVTLPLIHAFSQLEEFKSKAQQGAVTRLEINEAVAKTDGLRFTKLMVQRYYQKANKLIDKLEISDDKKVKLEAILKKASRLS